MILLHFFQVIVAVGVFTAVPATLAAARRDNLFSLVLLVVLFILMVEQRFRRVQRIGTDLTWSAARRLFQRSERQAELLALLFFIGETVVLRLGSLLRSIPGIGASRFTVDAAGVAVYLLHLVVVWTIAQRRGGSCISPAPGALAHILANLRFILVIVLPWLAIGGVHEFLLALPWPGLIAFLHSLPGQVAFYTLFLFLLYIPAPPLLCRLWECSPFDDGEMADEIRRYAAAQGIAFRRIVYWNAFHRTLLTAAVMGIVARFRYLLLTPALVQTLNREEILAVVSHETGHVRHRHMTLYMVFLIAFAAFSAVAVNPLALLLLRILPPSLLLYPNGDDNLWIPLLVGMLEISLFFFFIRYIFGYFMRHFERQADVFCFRSGVSPQAMVSAFTKLAEAIGPEAHAANWHHFSIPQRISFIRRCQEEPALIDRHARRVRRRMIAVWLVLFGCSAVGLLPFWAEWRQNIETSIGLRLFSYQLERMPDSAERHLLLGQYHYERREWEEARRSFEASLRLHPGDPEAANSLAWLLLTAPGYPRSAADRRRALELAAMAAAKMPRAAPILDTYAVACVAAGKYDEAVRAAEEAVKYAVENQDYYREQWRKIKARRDAPHE